MTSWSDSEPAAKRHDLAVVALFLIFFVLVTVAVVTRENTTLPGGRADHAWSPAVSAPAHPGVQEYRPEHRISGLVSNLILTVPIIVIGAVLFLAWGNLRAFLRNELSAQTREDMSPDEEKGSSVS